MGNIRIDYGAMSTGAGNLQNAGNVLADIQKMAHSHKDMLRETWQSSASDSFEGAFDRLNLATTQVQQALLALGRHVHGTNQGFQQTDQNISSSFARFG